ncbi:oxygenase MpaB family protein [Dietzia sp.]|uniref:oxygenase MpaB family protein n=1 Tax=Dietzia sp. TaxID=1871616 RepID=UPI002FDAFF25
MTNEPNELPETGELREPHSTQKTPPSRFRLEPEKPSGPFRAMAALWRIGAPSAEEWRRVGDFMNLGDPVFDRLAEWMHTEATGPQRGEIHAALASGATSDVRRFAEVATALEQLEAEPDWLDREKLAIGARALRRGGSDGMYFARDVSLMGGYQFSDLNKTLVRTGALEKGANQRFAETMRWALDLTGEGGLDPWAPGFSSTAHVRLIHAVVRRSVAAMPDWDSGSWGTPINQTDMGATLAGALITPAAGALTMGVVCTPRELDAVAHFTRYVGTLMGVRDEFLPHDFRDSIRLLCLLVTAQSEPDESSALLAAPLGDTPLEWRFGRFEAVRRRIARQQHLSMAATFLGPSMMRRLGLPAALLPWYPALRLPINAARSAYALSSPERRRRSAIAGGRAQWRFYVRITGGEGTDIGASAAPSTRAA